jgi:predicted exporter
MGTVIAGISIDYGIFVYMAARGSGRPEIVKAIAKPVMVGALTTMSIFAAFFFSTVDGYKQLALFSCLSILICLAYSLWLLPHFLKTGPPRPGSAAGGAAHGEVRARGPLFDRAMVGLWLLIMIFAGVMCFRVKFDNDVTQFDGVSPGIARAEKDFYDVWGGREKPAVFVVPGASLEEALEAGERIYREAAPAIGEENFISLAPMWPSLETRRANALRWERFWVEEGREEKLKDYLAEYGREYGFSEDAFSPFFENLRAAAPVGEEPRGAGFFDKVEEQFIAKKPDGCQVLSYFPDKEEYREALQRIADRHPGSFLVSRNAFSRTVSRAVSADLAKVSVLAALLIVGLTRLLLRDTRLTLLVMVPVAASVVMMLGALPLLGLPLTTPSLFALMVVVGIVSDYGIFIVYSYCCDVVANTLLSVSLAALTTLIGIGVLLFAKHPVLFSIGSVLVTGVASGYVSSLLVIPSLFRLWTGREGRTP